MTAPLTSFLLRRPLISPLSLTLGLGTAGAIFTSQTILRRHRQPQLCEAAASPLTTVTEGLDQYARDAKVPVFRNGRPNPAAYRQLSAGSILGLLGGVAVSTFSRTLALVFGLMIFGVQYLTSKGYDILPTSKIQRYVKGIDLRSAVEDNVAFKLSFGATFALASLAEL